MNQICLVGRIVNDPEARQTQGGVTQSKFRVAVNRDFKNAEGKYDADFFNIVAWKGTADFCNRYLQKGRLVEINGRVQTGKYEKDGAVRYTFDVMVNTIKPLERAQETVNGGTTSSGAVAPPSPKGEGFTEVDDDELPF